MSFKKLSYLKYSLSKIVSNLLTKRSQYSQHGEDILVSNLLNKIDSFIDIGANDGVFLSNTYFFAKRDVFGLCIEPSKSCFWKLRLNQILHPKVKCINAATSNFNGFSDFKEDGYEGLLSSITDSNKSSTYKVKTLILKQIIKNNDRFKKADIVSIDVEGHELNVLDGAGNSLKEVKIIIIEVDKINLDQVIQHKSLIHHRPAYTNNINLILLNKSESFEKPDSLPSGFYKF
jgi:FkbM family methyltransferase